MYSKILLATDGSPHAQKAAEYVLGLLKQKPEARATVVYVKHFIREYHVNRGIGVEVLVDEEAVIGEARENILNKAGSIFAGAGINVETKVLFGNAPEVICELAESGGYDLIVMGSRGLSEIQGFFLGSVSNRVLHLAHCSVLIVKG